MPFEWKLTIIFVGQCQRPRLAEMAILPLSPNALTNRNKRKLPSNKSNCRLNGNNKMFFSFQCMTFCGIVSLFSYWFLCKKKNCQRWTITTTYVRRTRLLCPVQYILFFGVRMCQILLVNIKICYLVKVFNHLFRFLFWMLEPNHMKFTFRIVSFSGLAYWFDECFYTQHTEYLSI